MASKHRKLNEKEQGIYNLLLDLRAAKISYCFAYDEILKMWDLEERFFLLRQPSDEELIKGLLIRTIFLVFGHNSKSDLLLMALGLLYGYDSLNIVDRREAYNNDRGESASSGALRKKEEAYFIELATSIAFHFENHRSVLSDRIYGMQLDLVKSGIIYFTGEPWKSGMQLRLPKPHDDHTENDVVVSKRSVHLTTWNNEVAEQLHQRIQAEGNIVDLSNVSKVTNWDELENSYRVKYHDEYDLMITITVFAFEPYFTIMVTTHRVIGEEIISMQFPCKLEYIELLLKSFNHPLVSYSPIETKTELRDRSGHVVNTELFKDLLKDKGVLITR